MSNEPYYPHSLLKPNRERKKKQGKKPRGRRKFRLRDWRESQEKRGDDERKIEKW